MDGVSRGTSPRLHSTPSRRSPRRSSRSISAPEPCVVVRFVGQDLFDGEALPRCADLGMAEDRLLARKPEELVQQAAVANVHLGRSHLPLAQIGMPRLELADHQRVGEKVEVPARG